MTCAQAAILTVVAALLAAADTVPAYLTDDGRVRIVGYNDMQPMLAAITREVAARHPGLRFDLDLKSTRSAPAAFIAGASLLAPMGAELAAADRTAFRAAWGGDPVAVRIAHDSIDPAALSSPSAVLVSSAAPIRSITLTQLRRLFAPRAGEAAITRWGELGAKGSIRRDRPLHAVTLAGDTAIGGLTLRRFEATAFRDGVVAKRQSRDVAAMVATDPDAVGLANLNFARGPVRALTLIDDAGVAHRAVRAEVRSGRYPLDRFLLIYVRRRSDGTIEPLAHEILAAALSPHGQRIIAQAPRRYIPLNRLERRAERAKLDKVGESGGFPASASFSGWRSPAGNDIP